jgi:hypothetical protein
VFVSSTFIDLEQERAHVINELNRDGHIITAAMEKFTAANEEQLEYIKSVIDNSDYFVVIIKGRYGSLHSDEISFTEKEFDYAVSKGKRILPFIYNQSDLKISETEECHEKALKLKSFISRIEANKVIKKWRDKDDLASFVKDAVHDAIIRTPGDGWIRGTQAMTPDAINEFQLLKKENEELKEIIAKYKTKEESLDSNFKHGEDILNISIQVMEREKINYRFLTKKPLATKPTYDELIPLIADAIYEGWTEPRIRLHLQDILLDAHNLCQSDYVKYELKEAEIRKLRFQFEAIGLIRTECRCVELSAFKLEAIKRISASYIPETTLAWRPTDRGRNYISKLLAERR